MSLLFGINRGALAWPRIPSIASSLSRFMSGSAAAARVDDEDSRDQTVSFKLEDLFKSDDKAHLTPAAVVEQLDRSIIGQSEAKVRWSMHLETTLLLILSCINTSHPQRAVAIALRNRWRRQQLPVYVRDEVIPKNILMIGPTGCGKTEIARRLAKLVNAPFIKVEATKYTELGYVGRDVEDIVKDLVEASINLVRQRLRAKIAAQSSLKAEAMILKALVGEHADKSSFDAFRDLYRRGELDDHSVSLDLPPPGAGDSKGKGINIEHGIIMLDSFLRSDRGFGNKRGQDKREMTIREAKAAIEEQEAEKVMQSEQVTKEAIRAAENDGIVFIDEIDKIVESRGVWVSGSVSSEGVQRDLLPIIEGSTVSTKHGNVSTDHVLFICSGAFHSSKPSDMLAELQGRLPIRVELKGLNADDMYRILTEPDTSMVKQQVALLKTEGVELEFTEGALKATAQAAADANKLLDNIGARRLHTVLERILSDISFNAPALVAQSKKETGSVSLYPYKVTEEDVAKVMAPLLKTQDLSKYVL